MPTLTTNDDDIDGDNTGGDDDANSDDDDGDDDDNDKSGAGDDPPRLLEVFPQRDCGPERRRTGGPRVLPWPLELRGWESLHGGFPCRPV